MTCPDAVRRCAVVLGLVLVAAGGGPAAPAALAAQGFGPGSPVTRIREIRLQESPAVINVTPVVRPDPRGGYLVADVDEGQIRRYDEDGHLLWHVGRKGRGPEEFQAPQIALRLPGGEVFVADNDVKVALWQWSSGLHGPVTAMPVPGFTPPFAFGANMLCETEPDSRPDCLYYLQPGAFYSLEDDSPHQGEEFLLAIGPRRIAVGADHACAIAKDGSTYCVGKNDRRQLGVGPVLGP